MVLYLSLGLDIPQAGQQKQGHFHEQDERKWNLYWRSTKDHMIHLCFFVLTCWPCFAVVLLNKVCTEVEKELVTTGFLILMTQTSVKLWACDCFSLENDMSKCCRGLIFCLFLGLFACFCFVLESVATILIDYFFLVYLLCFLSCYDFLWKAILCLPSDSEG